MLSRRKATTRYERTPRPPRTPQKVRAAAPTRYELVPLLELFVEYAEDVNEIVGRALSGNKDGVRGADGRGDGRGPRGAATRDPEDGGDYKSAAGAGAGVAICLDLLSDMMPPNPSRAHPCATHMQSRQSTQSGKTSWTKSRISRHRRMQQPKETETRLPNQK